MSSGLKRNLRARHVSMMALGGAIGTGLFLASGEAVSQAGPGGSLAAYALMGVLVLAVMQSLAEMAAAIPVSGSFQEYARRFTSEAFGFATGWNYWFNEVVTVAAELSAAAIVMQYWFPDSSAWLWAGLFLLLLVALNALTVGWYGESEFWFALIKVVAVLVFLTIGVAMIVGILGDSPGGRNWNVGEAPFVGGAGGVAAVFMVAGFAFQGVESMGVAAGEMEDPTRSIPRATHAIFWRILLFYVGAIAVIGTVLPYTDPNLLNSDVTDVAVSPFTLVLDHAGVLAAAAVMNAIILASVLSSGNSVLYVSVRMLRALAATGSAPRGLAVVSKRGVPVRSLLACVLVAAALFALSMWGNGSAYLWLVTASSMSGFLSWMSISWSHIRFRRAMRAQHHSLSALPYRAPLYPVAPVLSLALCAYVVVGQVADAALSGAGLGYVVAILFSPALFLLLWWGHRAVTGSRRVRLEEADLSAPPGY